MTNNNTDNEQNFSIATQELIRYDRMLVVLHWVLAIALIAQWGLGNWMVDLPKEPPGYRAGWFNLHKSIGLVMGLVILWRMGWRLTHSIPAPLEATSQLQRLAARLTHGLLYVCMLAMPVSGFLSSSFSNYPVKFFGFALPRLFDPQPDLKSILAEVHESVAFVFAGLVALHLLAVAWHVLVKRDGLLQRMKWGDQAVN
jgi:cytochrome b561